MRKDIFSTYHPAVTFLYFVMVMGCTMFVMHPIFLGISLTGGFLYHLYLKNMKAVKTGIKIYIPVFLLCAFTNPLFNHKGVTILTYLPSGNPLTLESFIYGFAAGVLLVTVLNWFSCYQIVMTSDKFIYLFGKLIPAMSLILSMVFRFVPKFKTQIEKVSDAQKCIGRDVTNGTMLERSRHGMKILSIMTTWALENSVDTADSMKSRGYGLRGRTNFTIYRFDTRDRIMVSIMIVFGLITGMGILTKTVDFYYYPMIMGNDPTVFSLAVYIGYGALCMLPFVVNMIEDIKWHYLKLKI